MKECFGNARFLVITGNYGSGKTEISLNLAFDAAREEKTTLVDLDIVNPYFRTGEKAEELKAAGVRVLMPTYAMTTVDIPALPAEIQSVFEVPSDRVIFDVGGDDDGGKGDHDHDADHAHDHMGLLRFGPAGGAELGPGGELGPTLFADGLFGHDDTSLRVRFGHRMMGDRIWKI